MWAADRKQFGPSHLSGFYRHRHCGGYYGPVGRRDFRSFVQYHSALIGGNILGSLFAICNIGSGLIVGFMARRKKFHTIPHVLVATVLVALWNAIVGSPIAMVVYGGVDGNTGTNLMIAGL